MARFITSLMVGSALTLIGLTAVGVHAAAEDGTGDEAVEVTPGVSDTAESPVRDPAPVYSAAILDRVECLVRGESRGRNIANLTGSGAVGILQYMPRTFAAHAAELGHFDWSPWIPWQARIVAAHDLVMGRRLQWTVSGC